jgi:hypothetical protein
MWFRRRFGTVLLVFASGCSQSSPGGPSPGQPSTIPASYTVSGTLFETVDGVSRPIQGQVRLFDTGTCPSTGGCRVEQEVSVQTDGNGHYTAQAAPGSLVFAYPRGFSGKVQPCVSSARVVKATTIDVEILPAGSVGTPPAAADPIITGFVYENTSDGRRPLRDVVAWLEVGIESYAVALTQTDQTGHFFFCRVNSPVRMGVSSYQEWFREIPGTGNLSFEIGLR